MPSRKPSTQAGSSVAYIRSHRSNDSVVGSQTSSTLVGHVISLQQHAANGLSHQQKIIQVLVGRLWTKLPSNSGSSLTQIETDHTVEETIQCLVELSRDSLDVIAIALTDLLEKIAKHSDANGIRTIDVLQSQLFILKVLSVCMASRWHRQSEDHAARNGTAACSTDPESPVPPPHPASTGRSAKSSSSHRQQSAEHLSTPPGWAEPPPLDGACAEYLLVVMVAFLRQTAPPEGRLMSSANLSFEATFHDFESIEVDDAPQATSFSNLYDEETAAANGTGPTNGIVIHSGTSGTSENGSGRASSAGGLRPRMHSTGTPLVSFTSSGMVSPAGEAQTAPIPQLNHKFERTHKALSRSHFSLNALILKFAGRIVYHLSASNWTVVLQKIRKKIRQLAGSIDSEGMDFIDLYLMKHSALDRVRLQQILQETASLLVNMSLEAKIALAVPLRTAVWNWIDLFPHEFHEVMRSNRRLEGAPERVFDGLWDPQALELSSARALWPTLAVLSVISPERTVPDYFQLENRVSMKNPAARFVHQLQKSAHSHSKVRDVAIVCLLDICRGAARASRGGTSDDFAIRGLASDIVHDIGTIIMKYENNRPFWECADEIDVAMFADALVADFRFSPKQDALKLFETCLEPERSDAVKLVAIKACITLAVEQRVIQKQPDLAELAELTAPRTRNIFKYGGVRRNEVDKYGNLRRAALRPKAKKFTAEAVSDRELLAVAVLHSWKTSISFLFTGLTPEEAKDWVPMSLIVWEQQTDTSIQYSIAMAFNQVALSVHAITASDPLYESAVTWKLIISPAATRTVANSLLNSRMEPDKQRMWAEVGHSYAMVYIEPSHDGSILDLLQRDPNRVPALALLEIAAAVSLASADPHVSRLAAHTLRVLAMSERHPSAPPNKLLTEDDRGRRYPIYEQIGDPKIRVTGRLAWQKRVRRLYSTLATPHPYFVAVWEECYYRWCALTELVIRAPIDGLEIEDGGRPTGDRSLTIEEQKHQWQNLTLFLAACGSACLEETHNPYALQAMIPAELLPDAMRVLKDPRELITNFIQYLIDLLLTDSVMARETAKEALGSELSFRLHGKLLKHLDDVIQDITRGEKFEWNEQFAVFLDQFIAVLKLLAENTQSKDELLTVDVTPTLFALAGFINRFHDPEATRIRIKFCALCDSLFARPDMLSMRKEGNLRQHVLDILIDWIQSPELCDEDEDVRVQHDVNIASLRAAVHFLDRLELRSLDGNSSGDEAGHVASRLFIRYANSIMRPLEFIRPPLDDGESELSTTSHRARASETALEVRELVVKGVARLISANTESGVKHSLAYAYDQDPMKKIIFTKVFARVMGQGTKLDSPEVNAPVAARSRLSEMIKGPDITIALAICETCPSSEVDIIIPVLLNIFDTRQSLMQLMKALIDREMARTDNEAELFRGNSTCTRLLSAFARIHGYTYLRNLIVPLIKTMEGIPPGHSFVLDPSKVSKEEREQNQRNVEVVASSFLQIISLSVPMVPSMFRELCQHIGKTVNNYWPEAKFAALGAFIFLRFISPAVVSPDNVDVELPKENQAAIRKGLMIVAKIIQNLANNIFFGKEAHMASLNKFLEENIVNVTRFLSELNKYTPAPDSQDDDEWVGTAYDDTDTIVLHRFFDKHADKVGKELLSVSKPSAEGDASAINGKRAWDAICAALVELGQPIEIPRHSALNSSEHQDFEELMLRYNRRSTAAVLDLFVKTYTGKDQIAIFILFVSKMDVETLDIDLLLYHIFKTLISPEYNDRQFSIIFDWTSFGSTSQIPMQWLKYCIEMVPIDIKLRFDTSYVLNLNGAGHQYLRRVYNVTAGMSLSNHVKTCSSIEELLQFVPATCVAPLVYAKSVEAEPVEQFTHILMRQHHNLRTPVTLEIGTSHLRILSDKAQPISPSLACKPIEIIPFADISDVYNVSSAHDPSEFIVRKNRQSTTLYFSTTQRDQIVKSIRAAKGRMRSNSLPGTERFSRLSNVSAALLHVALLNLGAESNELRSSSYELLSSVIASFDLDANPTLSSKGVWHGSSQAIIPSLSDKIATAVPHLTLDFISEVCSTIDKADHSLRLHCISYMAPWLKNLPHFVDPTSTCYDHSGAKLRDCVRSLIDLTLSDSSMIMVTQKTIWTEIGRLDTAVVNVILDELMRAAIDGGVASQRCETICLVMLPLSSINVRGQILSKMRKALGKTSVKPTRNLADNTHWNEIATLSRLALVAGQHSRQTIIPQFYLPELLHLVTLIAATGETLVRSTIWALVMDALQALWLARSADPIAGPEIQQLHEEASTDETLRYFGLARAPFTNDLVAFTPRDEKGALDNQEGIVRFLMRVMEAAAQTKGLLNVWRARWMSLVTATAFQVSPAVQARAFIVLGALAKSDVDDDFFYQMLVALKTALGQFSDSDTIPVVSMLRCIRNVVPALLPGSRYLPQIFWLAVALLQSSHLALYLEAANLLRVTVETLNAQGLLGEQGMAQSLLEHRAPIEDIAMQLDQLLGLPFDVNFSFSLVAIIFKGMRLGFLREATTEVLRTLLRVASRATPEANIRNEGPGAAIVPDALGFFLALLPASTDASSYRQLLVDANADADWFMENGFEATEDRHVPRVPLGLLGITDNDMALFVISLLRTMILSTPGDDAETEILFCLLSDVAMAYPDVLALTYDGLQDKIKETFATSSNAAVLNAASYIFHVALQDPRQSFGKSTASLSTVDETSTINGLGRGHLSALEELRMNGLAMPVNFVTSSKPHAATKVINWIAALVVRMIE